MAAETTASDGNNIARRSGNYTDNIWHFDQLQSLSSDYVGEQYTRRVDELKEEVRMMFKRKEKDPLAQLEQIDIIQRLGLCDHFRDETKSIMKSIYDNSCSVWFTERNSLYITSLEFRLLRQHGYRVPQEIFNAFKDEKGKFKACLCEDIMGLLNLYEASFLLVKGESILEEAKEFAAKHLKEYIMSYNNQDDQTDQNITVLLVNRALEVPLHWMAKRLEARWFIDIYERRQDKNPSLLLLAKLDFNMVQSIHQEELKDVSRWWRNVAMGKKLRFARDRMVELYFWSIGEIFDPQLGYCRRMLTRVFNLITVIDDVYDVFGTVEELELFTDIVERWDINAMDKLPEYMMICFLTLYNVTNEIAFDLLREQGILVLKYLKKVWADLCKNYFKEAKWYKKGYTPTLQEYMENGWISIAEPVVNVHIYFLTANPIREEDLKCLEQYPNIIRLSSVICRLTNDLATASNELPRGDVPKSVQCYMHESGASEDESCEHIKGLVREAWTEMNEERFGNSPLPEAFKEIIMDCTRMTFWMYHERDWFAGDDHQKTIDLIMSILVRPIPLKNIEGPE